MKKNIGFIGLGKLGLPVALSIASKGYNVYGYDKNPNIEQYILSKNIPYQEERVDELFKTNTIHFNDISNVVKLSDIIFVPVQTPHEAKYEGITRIPDERVDFNYDALIQAIKSISDEVDLIKKEKIVVIISTVLPGTIEKNIKPILSSYIKLCYNPFFIAMGTTVIDFLDPEFVLMGIDDEEAADTLQDFYSTIHNKPVYKTTIKNAELIKVSYNTFIGMKIVFVNTLMEICHKIGANVDEVTNALCLSNRRLISTKYLKGGMGDGGGCHPRDNIAMSWLAQQLDLSHNFFDDLMSAREHQTEWLAELCLHTKLPIIILGKAFKPETNIQTGSPSVLLYNILSEKVKNIIIIDPKIDINYKDILDEISSSKKPYTYFIGTQHECFKDVEFNPNSIVIDPFRYITKTSKHINNNIQIINIGSSNNCE